MFILATYKTNDEMDSELLKINSQVDAIYNTDRESEFYQDMIVFRQESPCEHKDKKKR